MKISYISNNFIPYFIISSFSLTAPPIETALKSSKTMSVDLESGEPSLKRANLKQPQNDNLRIFLVWTECLEDCEYFPAADFIQTTKTGLEPTSGGSMKATSASDVYAKQVGETAVFIIFVHPLTSGLFRIHLSSPNRGNEKWFGTPLVDGMVVNRRVLGILIRQTVLNACRKKRIDSDSKQYSAVARKYKLKDILDRFRCSTTKAELYTSLFQDSQ